MTILSRMKNTANRIIININRLKSNHFVASSEKDGVTDLERKACIAADFSGEKKSLRLIITALPKSTIQPTIVVPEVKIYHDKFKTIVKTMKVGVKKPASTFLYFLSKRNRKTKTTHPRVKAAETSKKEKPSKRDDLHLKKLSRNRKRRLHLMPDKIRKMIFPLN